MNHMLRLTSCATALVILGACATSTPPSTSPTSGPESLAHKYLVVDTHIDVPFRLYRNPADVSLATESGDFDYPRAVAGGLDALFMSIYIPAAADAAGGATSLADELIDLVEGLVDAAPEKFQIATCAADVDAIRASSRIAFPMGMENGGPIAGKLDNLEHFAGRGIRYITLAHSRSNHISDSSYDPDEHWQGLSPFGKSLIPAMNERGVMVDVSHISDRAFWQVLELSRTPVVATHSSLRHFTPGFIRNMSDDMVVAMKD
ncbi:MAG: dipeptidase, partial [Gammaproteobacteria bacterium]|nr:dipeptidase [Gammaproteobacteria bacterium]